ncbi:YifB family Mg chelatase-like AAA ATPase [Alloscardovia criceti]|uniref:YifB family Mg chelatase-like AAA ATPase n=1 Tax=Alloscardovia criceti TaxID=356828 RepID=UPI00036972D1|nr:YifB family Mg chelatase-like AAA ATPase [Alloscardovia criceti]
MHVGNILAVAVNGMHTDLVAVQSFITNGLPHFSIIGSKDSVLLQARERVRSACKNTAMQWPHGRITVNLSPALVTKRGSQYDLSIAASLLSALDYVNPSLLDDTVVMGELGIDGSVLPINAVLPIVMYAQSQGISRIILPHANLSQARIVSDMEVIGVHNIQEFMTLLGTPPQIVGPLKHSPPAHSTISGTPRTKDTESQTRTSLAGLTAKEAHSTKALDYQDIIGQEDAKWCMQIAAAGAHHLLLQGPPGAGKSMLAQRLPSILPELSEHEAREIAFIHSCAGADVRLPLAQRAPFISVHHNASLHALVGGSSPGGVKPGAMSLAHHGVLFLDEAPEFQRQVLQALRTPLEDGYIKISRAKESVSYPAQFQLVLAQNPCPCGLLWSPDGQCTCTPSEIRRHRQRISKPIQDRIDIKIDVNAVHSLKTQNASSDAYSPLWGDHAHWDSAHMRDNVRLARERAARRFQGLHWSTNAHASSDWLLHASAATVTSQINKWLENEEITMRGATKILRIAWSVSDILGKAQPGIDEVMHARVLFLPGVS